MEQNLSLYRIFYEVAQTGNISRAAFARSSAVFCEDKLPLNESEANKNFISFLL